MPRHSGGKKTSKIESEASMAERSSVEGAKSRGKKLTKFAEDVDGITHAGAVQMGGVQRQARNVGRQGPTFLGDRDIGYWGARQDPRTGDFAFPTVYAPAPTKAQQISKLKHESLNKTPGGQQTAVGPYGMVTATDKDYEWILSKENIKRAIDYDRLFLDLFDPSDPAQVELMRELRPEFFEERMKYIKQIASIQVHLAEIYLTGIRTRDDLDLILGLQMVDLPPSERNEMGLPKVLDIPVFKLNKGQLLGAEHLIAGSEDAERFATGPMTLLGLIGRKHPGQGERFGLTGRNFGYNAGETINSTQRNTTSWGAAFVRGIAQAMN